GSPQSLRACAIATCDIAKNLGTCLDRTRTSAGGQCGLVGGTKRAERTVACGCPSSAGARRMIPTMNIIAWGNVVPWAEQRQVEQDLIISRSIVDIFGDPFLREQLRF